MPSWTKIYECMYEKWKISMLNDYACYAMFCASCMHPCKLMVCELL